MSFKEILNALSIDDLRRIAILAQINEAQTLNKVELIDALYEYEANQDSNGVRFAELVKQL